VPTTPDGYPYGLSDDELTAALSALAAELRNAGYGINPAMQFGPVLALGQTEMTNRVAARAARSSEIASRRLIVLTGVLVVLTIILAVATIALLVKS
jgi:hypothetical protein